MHLPLQKSIAYVLSTPEMAATLAGLGVEPVGDAPVQFGAYINRSRTRRRPDAAAVTRIDFFATRSYASNSNGHIPFDVAFTMGEAAMIAKQLFGRTGHESTRAIFGAAALSKVTQDEADQTLEVLLKPLR